MRGSKHLRVLIISFVFYFIDFCKAFYFINHNVLLHTFFNCNFPPDLCPVIGFFLQDQEQFLSTGNTNSTVCKSIVGTPQGTIAGPSNFKLLIKDLFFILIVLNTLMTLQCHQSQLIRMIVHYSQELIIHAHGLSKMACI